MRAGSSSPLLLKSSLGKQKTTDAMNLAKLVQDTRPDKYVNSIADSSEADQTFMGSQNP